LDKEKAAKIIDYVVTTTKPLWEKWIHLSYKNLDDIFLSRAFEQGGFQANIFYEILKDKAIGSISAVGRIMQNYSGSLKYKRDEAGGLDKQFYQELRMGKYGEEGVKFFKSVEEFLKNRKGLPGMNFWRLIWYMLVDCNYLRKNYQSSFKHYLKSKYCQFKKIDYISDADFCGLSEEEWQKFVRETKPWRELSGVGPNVFDYIVRDIDEFRFNRDTYKLDSANDHFFRVTGIAALVNLNDRDSVIEFLKGLKLSHPYKIKEINTGIYAYCSRTEKKNFGFCLDKARCQECGVNEYCEKKFSEIGTKSRKRKCV